jgi:hypothetical protein
VSTRVRAGLFLCGVEIQRRRIHAVAETRGRGAVFEDVSQMGIALGAADFGAHHAVGRVPVFHDASFFGGLVETRPAGAGVELGIRIKQRSAAANAVIHTRFFRVPVLARKGTLGPSFTSHMILLGRELLFPLSFRLRDFFCRLFSHDEPHFYQ